MGIGYRPNAVPTIWNQPEIRIRPGLRGDFVAPLQPEKVGTALIGSRGIHLVENL